MLLLDVDNTEFEQLCNHPQDCRPGLLYGSQFAEHYEVIDYTVEYASYLFKNEIEAKEIISEKYEDIEVTSQITMFDYA